jgi:hypothetical protein
MSATTVTNYGFVQAGYVMADNVAVGATTKAQVAMNDETTATGIDEEAKAAFTSATSRWGMNASNGSKTTGKLEFDLNAGQASGVASSTVIRVRQAHMAYKMSENATITMGKKWTKFMGVNPFTMAATRVSFGGGNNGFIVDGIDYTRMMGNTSFSVELSNVPGDANVTAVNTSQVSGTVKTINVDHKMGAHKFGLAHTMADLNHEDVLSTNKDSKASGTKVYWAGTFGATAMNFQYTAGSNLGSIHTGALASASATNDEDIKETGIILSAKHSMESWSVFGSYGVSELAKEEEAGTGIAKNTIMSLGFDHKLDAGLVAFVEHQAFTTGYYVTDEVKNSAASTTEIGMKYTF